MTPLEEQVEKLARAWDKDAEQIGGIRGDYAAGVSSTFQSAATQLRALLPLEVTDESVTVTLSREEIEAVFEAMSTGYSHEGPMDQHLKAVYPKLREALLACLPPSPRRESREPVPDAPMDALAVKGRASLTGRN